MAVGAEHLLVTQPVCIRLTFGCRSDFDVIYLGFKIMLQLLATSFAGQSIAFNDRFSDGLLSPAAFRPQPHIVQVEYLLPGQSRVFCCVEIAEFTAHVLLSLNVRWHDHAYLLRAETLS